MSGVFWEADKQPNLCDAASGFTISTINLAVAIPMAIVDILVAIVTTMASFIWILLGPVIEYIIMGLTMIMEMVGLTDISSNNVIVAMLVGSMTIGNYLQTRGKANGCQKLVARISNQCKMLLLILGFLNFSPDNAAYPRLALLSLAFHFGSMVIGAVFNEYNNYSNVKSSTVVDGVAQGIIKCLDLESTLMLCVAAFGYPTISVDDDVTKYYCLVPLVAVHLIYFGPVRSRSATEDVVDHINGDATVVKETVPPANINEDTGVAKEEKPAEEAVTGEVAPEPAEKSVDGSTVENIEEIKTEAMIKRLQGCVCSLISRVMSIISPVTNLITKTASIISNLPWSWMTLMASDNLSIILLTMAWFSLTSNILCYAIPVLRILVPMIMTKAERIPDSIKANVEEFSSLSLGVVQYCLIAGVTVVSESE